jgi:5-methylcytosine-specific restriction endonuclease McrA
MPKIKSPVITKTRFARKGERTLTQADKKKEMRNSKHVCQKCKKKFPAHLLDIHHKRSVASHKIKEMVDIGYIEFYTKRKKRASYDRSKNLMVLCPTCHRKVHKEESEKRKAKKKKVKKRNPNSFW